MDTGRKIAAIFFALLAVLLMIEALTVPLFAMTGPLILAVVCAGITYLIWPRNRGKSA